jgi:acetyl-CoA C-acetyltransferase
MTASPNQPIGALYVANALGAALGQQSNLAPAIAGAAGLHGCETLTIDAGGAAGGLAIRQAMLAVASGMYDAVAVVGVEKVSDVLDERREAALALTTDGDWEGLHGVTLTSQWAMLMRKYMHDYAVASADFAAFPVNAHANAVANRHALYRFAITSDKVKTAGMVAAPLSLLDCATVADGAAAVIISAHPHDSNARAVRIAGSGVASDAIALHERADMLDLVAVRLATTRALQQANLTINDVNALDMTDPHAICAVLTLEAMGYTPRGTATTLGASGAIRVNGTVPLALTGGCKARGDVVGALGVYQIVELTAQLRGTAANQVANATVALATCSAGITSTVVTHVLVAE